MASIRSDLLAGLVKCAETPASRQRATSVCQSAEEIIITVAEPGGEVEGGALADLAFNPDFAAHQVDQARGDGQTQAGAAVFPRRRAVGLNEGLENRLQPVGWDADAGVGDRKMEADLAGSLVL